MNRVIIIGASSGLGRALAEQFIAMGWKVGLAARRLTELQSVKSMNPANITIARIDVSEDNSVDILNKMIEDMGGMDLYLHCAGILVDESEVSSETLIKVTEINAVGFGRMVASAFDYFCKSGKKGQIAAISSIAGFRGLEALPAYSASKAFDSTYLEALRQKADGLKLPITITDIKPGWTRTPLLDSDRKYIFEMDADKVTNKIMKAILRKRKTAVIGKRWKILTALERIIPTPLWQKIHVPIWVDKE